MLEKEMDKFKKQNKMENLKIKMQLLDGDAVKAESSIDFKSYEEIKKFHNISALEELLEVLLHKMKTKEDVEKIMNLEKKALRSYQWDYTGLKSNPDFLASQIDWNQTLITKINEASHIIRVSSKNVHLHEKDFYPLILIVSSEVSAIMDDLEYFHLIEIHKILNNKSQTEEIGYISSVEDFEKAKYIVFKNPYIPTNKIIICQPSDFNSDILSEDCITSKVDVINLPL